MEQLRELLGVGRGVTAVMGSGGKTSLLYQLAEELRPCGTVLLATTTHIMRPPQYPFAGTAEELAAALAAHGAACAGSYTPEGKLTAPAFAGWQQAADFVLVEADGSKRLPAKASRRGSRCCRRSGRAPSACWGPPPSGSLSGRRRTVPPSMPGWRGRRGRRPSRRRWRRGSSVPRDCVI